VPTFNTAMLFFRRIRLGGVAVGANSNAESRAAWLDVLDLLARVCAAPGGQRDANGLAGVFAKPAPSDPATLGAFIHVTT
jgi:hypothetical protein